jgi:hypothetical protein
MGNRLGTERAATKLVTQRLHRKDRKVKKWEKIREYWLPPRDSNPDMLIQSQLSCR